MQDDSKYWSKLYIHVSGMVVTLGKYLGEIHLTKDIYERGKTVCKDSRGQSLARALVI